MAKRQGVVTWNLQDIQRVSAESTVCVRTIVRALAGAPIRPSSKLRIRSAAEKLKLRIPALLCALSLLACGSASQNPFEAASGGAAGMAAVGGEAGFPSGGEAGQSGGSAGMEGGAAGAADDGGSGEASNSCTGIAGGFLGCQTTGCLVCTENVSGYPNYFANHPGCVPLGTCIQGVYGVCSANCPMPTEADK